MAKVIVVGGGAAGMMAAISSAKKGNQVILIEKNEKLGKKVYITGKGRCNLTNYTDIPDFMNNVVTNAKFLYGAINNFSSYDTYDFFENNGLKLKVERGNRVFPDSDKSNDVIKTLKKILEELKVKIRLNESVESVTVKDNKVCGVITDVESIDCDSVIICTGGISYSSTGSTGDGYAFATSSGHKLTALRPSLVGIELKGADFIPVQGISLKNVAVKCVVDGKTVYEDFGEMLFTHYGVSGPIILSCSCLINKLNLSNAKIYIDLKPALDVQTLDKRLIREFGTYKNACIFKAITTLMPKNLAQVVLFRTGINSSKKCCEIKKEEREKIIKIIKALEFDIKGLRPIEEAIVTSGGVCVNDINPKSMESKIVKGLFFAGEILDVDAFTGGFNLQIAFSTGYLAGMNS